MEGDNVIQVQADIIYNIILSMHNRKIMNHKRGLWSPPRFTRLFHSGLVPLFNASVPLQFNLLLRLAFRSLHLLHHLECLDKVFDARSTVSSLAQSTRVEACGR